MALALNAFPRAEFVHVQQEVFCRLKCIRAEEVPMEEEQRNGGLCVHMNNGKHHLRCGRTNTPMERISL